MDFLDLDGLRTIDKFVNPKNEDELIVTVEGGQRPTNCNANGCGSDRLQGHGAKIAQFRDMPIRRMKVLIRLKRPRVKCVVCGSTQTYDLEVLDGNRHMTKRLVNDAKIYGLKQTFASLSRELGLQETTVADLVSEYIDFLDKNRRINAPKILGVDEFYVLGQANAIFTNVDEKSIYDVVDGRKREDLKPIIEKIKSETKLELVVSDMFKPYRDTFRLLIPDVPQVIDRFHVVRMGNNAVERLRRELQRKPGLSKAQKKRLKSHRALFLANRHELSGKSIETLDDWLGKVPILGMAHQAKERFAAIYDYSDRDDARRAYREWRRTLPFEVTPYFKGAIGAWSDFEEEILNFFDFEYTNAFTESVNRLVKDLNRDSRGYSWRVLRAKVINYDFIRDMEYENLKKKDIEDLTAHRMLSLRQEDLDDDDDMDGVTQGFWTPRGPKAYFGPKIDDVAAWIRKGPSYRGDIDDDYEMNVSSSLDGLYRVDEQLELDLND